MFWELTPPERALVLEEVGSRERRMDQRFGLIAATQWNTTPGYGGPAKKPEDFFRYHQSRPYAERFAARPLMRVAKGYSDDDG